MGKRYVVIDVEHLARKASFSKYNTDSTVMVGGVAVQVNSALASTVIHQVDLWTRRGYDIPIVCFNSSKRDKSKAAYFEFEKGSKSTAPASYIKSKWETKNYTQDKEIVKDVLQEGGVTCLRYDNYSAADLIAMVVNTIKAEDVTTPIDIVTDDVFLYPLVDEQVSVFGNSVKGTYAESRELEKIHHIQVKPLNYENTLSALTTNFARIPVPYNTSLLAFCLRGSKSKGIGGCTSMKPLRYKKLLNAMVEDGVDFANSFRYGVPRTELCYRDTKEPIPQSKIETVPRSNMMLHYKDPLELDNMLNVLSQYLSEDEIEHVAYIYRGINLNTVYRGLGLPYDRQPLTFKKGTKFQGFDRNRLNAVSRKIGVRLAKCK